MAESTKSTSQAPTLTRHNSYFWALVGCQLQKKFASRVRKYFFKKKNFKFFFLKIFFFKIQKLKSAIKNYFARIQICFYILTNQILKSHNQNPTANSRKRYSKMNTCITYFDVFWKPILSPNSLPDSGLLFTGFWKPLPVEKNIML